MVYSYITDDVDNTVEEIQGKSWFNYTKDLDTYVLRLFGNLDPLENIEIPQTHFHEPTSPEICDEICRECNMYPCEGKTAWEIAMPGHIEQLESIMSRLREIIGERDPDESQSQISEVSLDTSSPSIPLDMWRKGSQYLKSDHVMIKLYNFRSNGPLEYIPCYLYNTFKANSIMGAKVKYIAISHVSSEGWFVDGLPKQLKHRIYNIGKHMGVQHVWIDELCLPPPGDRTRQLETMREIYRHAEAVCVISREVINSGNYRDLFSSIWITRAWTFQEGYNAKKLVILESSTKDKYVIMTRENVPNQYRYIILCGEDVNASLSISMAHSRNIGRRDDIPYVIASFVSGKIMVILSRLLSYYIMYLTIYASMMIIYGTLEFVRVIIGSNGVLSKFPTYHLFLLTIMCTCLFVVTVTYATFLDRGFKWKNVNTLFDNPDTVDWNVMLLSPVLEYGPKKCWSPDLIKQNPIDITTCMALTGSKSVNAGYLVRLCPSILGRIFAIKYVGKIVSFIIASFYYILRKHGLRVDGRLLNKRETREFIQFLSNLRWSWMTDVMAADTIHKDHRILLMFTLDDKDLYWMIFGFVMLDENNVLYRKHRFWILPVTHETATRCKQAAKSYYIGGKYSGNF